MPGGDPTCNCDSGSVGCTYEAITVQQLAIRFGERLPLHIKVLTQLACLGVFLV